LRLLTRSSLTGPYSALHIASASADITASANVLIIARSRSGLAGARISSVRAFSGRPPGAVIMLIPFEPSTLRHFDNQPMAVSPCGHQPEWRDKHPGSGPTRYATSKDATPHAWAVLRVRSRSSRLRKAGVSPSGRGLLQFELQPDASLNGDAPGPPPARRVNPSRGCSGRGRTTLCGTRCTVHR